MRFGYSPGWVGQSPTGLGPGASYLTTGQWPTPQAQAYWQATQAGQASYPTYGGYPSAPGSTASPGESFAPGMSPDQELDFLKNQAQMVKNQLSGIEDRIKELEKNE
jgi:hypothetical protein